MMMPDGMEPVAILPEREWRLCDETQKIMRILNDENAELTTLFVGGCIRNAVLNLPVEDIDLATKLTPQEAMLRLEKQGVRVIPTGIDHGTITAVAGDRSYEITTLRKDVETDGRRAVVAFSESWYEDAQRRDFTMNTLLADLDGNVYDPLGKGFEHLKERKIVFVGNAAQRIAEDHLRILRFFRFHALYGGGDMDPKALKACKAASDKISALSKERITQEFFKITASKRFVSILKLMFENKILKGFYISNSQVETLEHFCDFQDRYGLGSVASRIYVLADMNLKNLEKFSDYLLFPKIFLKDMQAIDSVLEMRDLEDDAAIKEAIYWHGRAPTAQALMIELAQDRVMNGFASKALDIIQNWDVPDFPLSGQNLIEAGLKPGPDLGKSLSHLENLWVESGFSLSRQKLLQEL